MVNLIMDDTSRPPRRDETTRAHSPLETVDAVDQDVVDACDLAALGHDQSLSRKFDIWSILALAFCVLGTWSTFAQDLSSGLTNGGPISILWGLCLVTICNICVVISLGELCSSMPTALGQAYWVLRLWDAPWGRFTSYICAWINTFGWWTLTASQTAFMTSFLLGMKVMFDPEWTGASSSWVQFLVYLCINALFTVFNLVACRKDRVLPLFNDFVGIGFVGLFVVLSLALLIAVGTKPGLEFQPGRFVFGAWINQTGWSDGVTVIHMVEEIPAPRRNAPRAMWLAVVTGATSGFIFMLVCLFCIQDLDSVVNSDLPFMQLVQDAVGLQGAAVLLAFFIFNGLGQVPARAIVLQGVIVALVGVLYLFANTVLEAIISTATIALTVSYALPIATLMIAGRDRLPPGGFRLGSLGPLINWTSVIYCGITTVFFFFPGEPAPAAADMNYAIAVFAVMLVVSIGFWLTKGRIAYMRTTESAKAVYEARKREVVVHEGVPGGHFVENDGEPQVDIIRRKS
ncbi:choline transport protein [Diaporthe helianthi]|uniref:Choline transport protein n=1 Tax=Diaporthe helianthi TaxID=158607 RepID=A0A2P5HT47_DIAHE|nr:choline transport protein [Diaporthe helianthi]